MTQCTHILPGGGRCPWDAAAGKTVCHEHWRAELRERRARIDGKTRELTTRTYLPPTVQEARERQWIALQREARRIVWHQRRDAERARKREQTTAARAAAQDAATVQECRVCARSLPLEAFARDRTGPLGRKTRCRDCQAVHDRERTRRRETG